MVEGSGDASSSVRWRVPVVDSALRSVENVCGVLAGAAIVAMMLLITADSILRYFFSSPLTGATEFTTSFLMVAAVWLASSAVERVGGHVGIDLVVRHFPGAVRALASLLTRLASILIVGLIAWATIQKTIAVWGDVTTGVFSLPVGPSWGLVAVGASLLALRLTLEAISEAGQLVDALRGSPEPEPRHPDDHDQLKGGVDIGI